MRSTWCCWDSCARHPEKSRPPLGLGLEVQGWINEVDAMRGLSWPETVTCPN